MASPVQTVLYSNSILINVSWLKSDVRGTALIPRQKFKPGQQTMPCGPNLAYHQIFYISELKIVFTFVSAYKKDNILWHVKIV